MPSDIEQWLKANGLGKHAKAFADNGVDLDILLRLSEDDLKELGLNLGDRRRLQSIIETLSDDSALVSTPILDTTPVKESAAETVRSRRT